MEIVRRHKLVIDGVVHLVVGLVAIVVVHLLLLHLLNAGFLAFLGFGTILSEYRCLREAKVELPRFNFFVSLRAQIDEVGVMEPCRIRVSHPFRLCVDCPPGCIQLADFLVCGHLNRDFGRLLCLVFPRLLS